MNSSSLNNESHSRDQITRFSQRLNSEYRKMKRSTFTYLNNPPTNQSRIASLLEGCTELKSIIEILFKKVKDRTPFENKQILTKIVNDIGIENTESDTLTISVTFQIQGENN